LLSRSRHALLNDYNHPYLTNVRKISAVVLLASLPGVVEAFRGLIATLTQYPQWATGLYVFAAVFALAPLLFLAALVVNDRSLHFPKRFRKLAMVATLCYGVFCVGSFVGGAPRTGAWMGTEDAVTQISNLAETLLLFVFFRCADDEPQERVSRFLSVTAKAATIVGAFGVALTLVRLLVVPFAYRSLYNAAYRNGATPPAIWDVVRESLFSLLTGIGWFTEPYMVWRSGVAGAIRDEPAAESIITPT
jgi:hypothetical protein